MVVELSALALRNDGWRPCTLGAIEVQGFALLSAKLTHHARSASQYLTLRTPPTPAAGVLSKFRTHHATHRFSLYNWMCVSGLGRLW